MVTASAARTCLGDAAATFDAMLRGRCGAVPLSPSRFGHLAVRYGYPITDGPASGCRAADLLAACVREVLAAYRPEPDRRMVAVIGTGLRELPAVERWVLDGDEFSTERLHFAAAVRAAAPSITQVLTVSNACSAGGTALALAQDLIELGEADAVLVGAADSMTESMLAMIGRTMAAPNDRVRPFDAQRVGVLLGEGAAAVVLTAEGTAPASARILGTGMSCDARHETAPDPDGITRAIADAFTRAGRAPRQVDLVIAHGTGTALNDATEARVLDTVFAGHRPPIIALKGAIGHTSGSAALHNVVVALEVFRRGLLPPITGLREFLPEGEDLWLVREEPVASAPELVMIDAFGFGGTNAVTLLERCR
ncbi:beta-ketoacyl synthase N-terminal-like domain-containing protein [Nocardia sp. NPDC051321]|uniref:beta-ketoacyl synthase N-terminal-like domain-containing protein n=1 Tax=Nocardia sp. NPDC051321 TaxID=3364323 RepID=UPI0037954841